MSMQPFGVSNNKKNRYRMFHVVELPYKWLVRCVTMEQTINNDLTNYCRCTLQQRRDAPIDDRDDSDNHDGDDGTAATASSTNVSADAHSAQEQQQQQ